MKTRARIHIVGIQVYNAITYVHMSYLAENILIYIEFDGSGIVNFIHRIVYRKFAAYFSGSGHCTNS